MKVVIIANGCIRDYKAAKEKAAGCGYLIACDGGLKYAAAMGLVPDCLLGDMDSAPVELRESYSGLILPYPAEKDDTDLALAMEHAISIGATRILVLGALGGRFDHALANAHVLITALEASVPAEIWDENTRMVVANKSVRLSKGDYDFLSVIPLTNEVKGITNQGLYYPLRGACLKVGSTRGISNRFTAEEADITIEEGILLVICTREEL